MKQMYIEESRVIPLDYESMDLSAAVRQFKPTVYRDGELICCSLGPGLDEAVHACGATEDEAIMKWDQAFKERLKSQNPNDEVALYIRDTLSASKNDVW